MSIDTLLVILLGWTAAGVLAAFAYGKAVQRIGTATYEEELLSAAPDNVRYFRNDKRKTSVKRASDALMDYGIMKEAS